AEELFICYHVRAEFAFQKSAELFRISLFQFSCSFVGERSLELDQLFSSELTVEPGRPFFFKCFHKRPSINFAISCAHKTSATSPCQSNSQAFRQSRDIASPQSPSLRSQRDGRARVARWRCQCASGFRTAPLSRRATRPLSALFWMRDRFVSPESHRQILRPPLSPVFSARSEEHTSELQSRGHLLCRLL